MPTRLEEDESSKKIQECPEREENMLEPQENGLSDLPDDEKIDETFPNPFPPPASPERDGEGAEP